MRHRLVDLAAQRLLEVAREADSGEVLLDGVLDLGEAEERQIAAALLAAAAEEVEVGAAVALRLGDHQPAAAAMAPDEAFEPVVVLALPGASAAMERQYPLDAVVGLLRDQGLVPAGVLDALEADLADVVAVGQHVVEVAERDGGRWVAAGAAGLEPGGRQALKHLLSRVLAGGEQFETFGDQRCAHRVNGDGADLTALGFRLADVEVAELGLADGAAVLDLLGHLEADVGTAGVGLVLVDGVDDGLDHGGFRVVAHVEHRRHHPSADFAQVTLDDPCVDAVSKDAVEVVDDDVVDVLLLLDPGDHLLERRSAVDVGG